MAFKGKDKEKKEKNKQTAGDLILNENHELESIDEKLFCFLLFNPVYLIDVIWKRSLTSQDERGDVLTTRSPYIYFLSYHSVTYICLSFFFHEEFFFFCFLSLLGSLLFPLSVNCHNTTNTSRYIRN